MARRLLSTEAVLEELELDDDFDIDEPMMAGSDDKFEDVGDMYLEDVEDDAAPSQPPTNDTQSSSSGSLPTWSSTLISITIHSFSSPVGPTVDIPESCHQLKPLTSCLCLIFWTTWCSRPTCMQRR